MTATQESLLARDKIDSGRATAPLIMADGAVHIDTTPYSLAEVIDRVVDLAGSGSARVIAPHDSSPHRVLLCSRPVPADRRRRSTSCSGARSRVSRGAQGTAWHLPMLIREHMLVHLDLARASTGQELPGPLPADEVEPDPATGVTEQGAT